MEVKEKNKKLTLDFINTLKIRKYASNTIRNYETTYLQINNYFKNDILHTDAKQIDIINFSKTIANYKSTTFNSKLSALSSFYNHLQDLDLIANNPVKKQMFRRLEYKEPVALDDDEIDKYFEIIEYHSILDQLIGAKILLATGIRLNELIRLDLYQDIEFRNNKAFLHIRESKSKYPRTVPVFDNILYYDLVKIRERYFDIGSYKLDINKNSFLHTTQKFYETYGYRITPHMLRHTFATRRYEEGLDLNTIRLLLGHRTINMTLLYIANRLDIYNLI